MTGAEIIQLLPILFSLLNSEESKKIMDAVMDMVEESGNIPGSILCKVIRIGLDVPDND